MKNSIIKIITALFFSLVNLGVAAPKFEDKGFNAQNTRNFIENCDYIQILEIPDDPNHDIVVLTVKGEITKLRKIMTESNLRKLIQLKKSDKKLKGLLVFKRIVDSKATYQSEAFGQDGFTRVEGIDIRLIKDFAK